MLRVIPWERQLISKITVPSTRFPQSSSLVLALFFFAVFPSTRNRPSERRGEKIPTSSHRVLQEWELLIFAAVTLPLRLSRSSLALWERFPFMASRGSPLNLRKMWTNMLRWRRVKYRQLCRLRPLRSALLPPDADRSITTLMSELVNLPAQNDTMNKLFCLSRGGDLLGGAQRSRM